MNQKSLKSKIIEIVLQICILLCYFLPCYCAEVCSDFMGIGEYKNLSIFSTMMYIGNGLLYFKKICFSLFIMVSVIISCILLIITILHLKKDNTKLLSIKKYLSFIQVILYIVCTVLFNLKTSAASEPGYIEIYCPSMSSIRITYIFFFTFMLAVIVLYLCALISLSINTNVLSIIKSKIPSKPKTTTETLIANNSSSAAELEKFKELLEIGAITQEEFEVKKKELL